MANVKGTIKTLKKNGGGFWTAGLTTGQKDEAGKDIWANIGFTSKDDTLVVDGVEVKAGMVADVEVEGKWNTFVSGTFKMPEKKPFNGKWGGKGDFKPKSGYDSTGQAVGGAVNRANELVACGAVKPVGAGVVAAAAYVVSELMKKAVEDGKLGTYCSIMQNVDITDYKACIAAKKAYMDATGGSTEASKPSPSTEAAPEKKESPKPSQKAKQAPPPEPDPQYGEEGEEDDCPFDDMPDF